MKIVVNSGHTVHVAKKPGIAPKHDKDPGVRPEVKVYGPTHLIDTTTTSLSDDEAQRLIARGVAYKFEEPKAPEDKKDDGKK